MVQHCNESVSRNDVNSLKDSAEKYLRKVLGNPAATFREGQWESIAKVLDKGRVLVVERTGWGKSMVYFLATKLRRDQGYGPTLIVSPLLSLMRNQIEAASRIGINAQTINSTNQDEWNSIVEEFCSGKVDVLLVSPERLANDAFRHETLARIGEDIGLFVVDEAHCISDWGHDFRPDYRLISRVLSIIPPRVPVLATTATANDRVIEDIESQLGSDIHIQRGPLVRKSLKLQNINLASPADRLAWLAEKIPVLCGSGIVYTLTQRDAETVAEWLKANGIKAESYHAQVSGGNDEKTLLEQKLVNNEIKVLVATTALGMGFDKPDLGFVIHYQRPSSVVHYYQQVGRAGRNIENAYGILLSGKEDEHIADYFIRNAFPPQNHISELLSALSQTETGQTVVELQNVLNLKKSQIEGCLKFLAVESTSPVVKNDGKWHATSSAMKYQIPRQKIDGITKIRRSEQQQMRNYMESSECLMSFLQNALNDRYAQPCGKCRNCDSAGAIDETVNMVLAEEAMRFLQNRHRIIKVRKQWPGKDLFTTYSYLNPYKIPEKYRSEEGRALSLWRDSGWGSLVAQGKYGSENFSDELVDACVELLQKWSPEPAPQWVTCIPSLTHPTLVPDFARRLAIALNLPFVPCVEKVRQNSPQKEMQNSHKQITNLDGAFQIAGNFKTSPCLLVDDMIDSGWTFTIASALLRKEGCSAVYPLALALNSPRMD